MLVKYTDHKDSDISKTTKGEGTLHVSIIIVSNSHIHMLTEKKLNQPIIKFKGHTDAILQQNFHNTLNKYKTKLPALVYYSG
jgi:hypothetical protein